jgi:GT2 family glycosyltransferase
VAVGVGDIAEYVFKGLRRSSPGYGGRLSVPVEYSAVTAACMMMRRAVFDEVGGFDPALAVAFNDVDLCMKIRKAGYSIVFTPFAELLHYESKSRGSDETGERRVRATRERWLFQERWIFELDAGDPYYNPAFGLKRPTFKEPASCRVGERGIP